MTVPVPAGTLQRTRIERRDTMATKKRKPSAAFMKPMTPSAALGEVIGDKALPRTQVTKKIWEYIKRRRLQDSKNRRMINADDALRSEEHTSELQSQSNLVCRLLLANN